jgi:23S rRNA pseudouridine2605 synthase
VVVRLQQILAQAGVASRRASEQIILAGCVQGNGQPVRVLGTKVNPGRDAVTLDGKPVRARRKLYVALHKPGGVFVRAGMSWVGRPLMIYCPRNGKIFIP